MPDYKVIAYKGRIEKMAEGKVNVIDLDDLIVIRVRNHIVGIKVMERLQKIKSNKRYLLLPMECSICRLEEIKEG